MFIHFTILSCSCYILTPVQFYFYFYGCEYTFERSRLKQLQHILVVSTPQAFSSSSLRPSTDQGHWWPQIHPPGFRISIARHSPPPYSSIRPSVDQGCWGLQLHLQKVMTLLSSPIPFYNTMGTVSVSLNWYAFTHISCMHFCILDHLAFDIADFLLHHGNGFYSFTDYFTAILITLFFAEI